jgi:hypothetical protein
MGAGDDHACAVLQLQRQLGSARDQLLAGHLITREGDAQEVGGRVLGGQVRGAHALDLGGDHRHEQPAHQRAGVGARTHVQSSHDRVGHTQRQARDVLAAGKQRALVGAGARGYRDCRAGRVGYRKTCVERA